MNNKRHYSLQGLVNLFLDKLMYVPLVFLVVVIAITGCFLFFGLVIVSGIAIFGVIHDAVITVESSGINKCAFGKCYGWGMGWIPFVIIGIVVAVIVEWTICEWWNSNT